MADWFAKLMQKGHARSRRATTGAGCSTKPDFTGGPAPRATRYDAIVRTLRDREAEDRIARERRQRWYRQYPRIGAGSDADVGRSSPVRLSRFRTKVPCRATPEARALLEAVRKQCPGGIVTFPHVAGGRHPVMLARSAGAPPKQIGWIEHGVETDPRRCNVRHQGLDVETDGGTMLVLRFRYPSTAVRMAAGRRAEEVTPYVEFAEIRSALELCAAEQVPPPRIVRITRPESEIIDALRSREYEAFYVRFKLELLTGIWSSLTGLLAKAPRSQSHHGAYYTIVREADAVNGRIRQTTVDDSGRAVDIGADRIYDAAAATDILLLHLDGDLLADVADIYFTLQALGSADAYFLKEEFFTIVRRFWAASQSLASGFGSDLAAVIRMSLRAMPMPGQAPLLRQDWITLRERLVDRYGDGGWRAAALVGRDVHRPRAGAQAWPFASIPAGEIDLGLRLIHRQEWRDLGVQRGEREVPRRLEQVMAAAVDAILETTKWPRDRDGRVDTGVRGLAAVTGMGLEAECRESSRETSSRFGDLARQMATRIDGEARVARRVEPEEPSGSSSAVVDEDAAERDAEIRVYSRLQQRYEVLTRLAEVENVVLVAEPLPTPAEIDRSWVRRHDWILAKALLDESFRGALSTIHDEARAPEPRERDADPDEASDESAAEVDAELRAGRERLLAHVRAHILHYQRAIWQQEDPQQRSMRYRKSGATVPLDWRFELEAAGALTIDELGDRLTAANVDGQFAAYSDGRLATLDQVIDPAGPIGYYGNCAIHRMRPELGSGEVFAMLHFFKSPYLRANPETGEPEIEDPTLIRLAEDPAVASASDETIARHRDEMFDCVPALRVELARARGRVRDGTDPGAVDRLQRQWGALRRHFAAFLFHRERARRMVLDTDGVVIDVLRRADTGAGREQPGRDDDASTATDATGATGASGADEAREEFRLLPAEGHALELLMASAHPDAEAERLVLPREDREPTPLRAGTTAGSARARERESEAVIVTRGDDAPRLVAWAGRAAPRVDARPILASGSSGSGELTVGAGAAAPHETTIRARRDDDGVAGLRVGRAHAPDAEQAIVSREDEERRAMLLAGAGNPGAHDDPIRTRGDRGGALQLTLGAATGAAPADARPILPRGDGEPALRLHAGTGTGRRRNRAEQPARAGDAPDDAHTAAAATSDAADVVIVAPAAREPAHALVAGLAHDPATGAVILAGQEAGPRLTVIAGSGALPARERTILAVGEGERMPSLRAGTGAGRVHERAILVRGSDWLRPSLIAG